MDLTAEDLDAGKRAAAAVNLHVEVEGLDSARRWVAVKLSDGTTDGTLYDTWAEAVAHQHDEHWCCYLQVQPGGITPREAAIFIKINRTLPQPYPPSEMDRAWFDRYRRLKNRMMN